MGPLKAGDLTHRVSVLRQAKVADGYGNTRSKGFSQIASRIPAKVSAMKGGEAIRGQRLASINAVEVWVRANSQTLAILPTDRIRDDRTGVEYEIKNIADLRGMGSELLITCEGVK